jgi:hypothetical protein
MTLDAHALAVERGQATAALSAIEMLGEELHGMFKGYSGVDVSSRMREMSDAELLAVLDRNLGLLGLPRVIASHSGDPDSASSESRAENQDDKRG